MASVVGRHGPPGSSALLSPHRSPTAPRKPPPLIRQFSLKETAILAHLSALAPPASSQPSQERKVLLLEAFKEESGQTSPVRIRIGAGGSPRLTCSSTDDDDASIDASQSSRASPRAATPRSLRALKDSSNVGACTSPQGLKSPAITVSTHAEDDAENGSLACFQSPEPSTGRDPRRLSFEGVPGSVSKRKHDYELRERELELTWMQRWGLMIAEAEREAGERCGGTLVIYTTSMQAIQRTHSACMEMRKLLCNLRVEFEDRDVFLDKLYTEELEARRPGSAVPMAFFNGDFLGDHTMLTQLNEDGKLLEALKGCPIIPASASAECGRCASKGLMVCSWCGGSKKSMSGRFGTLKCTACNENGLVRCSACRL